MRSYRLDEKVKMLMNHQFDIDLYKSPEYTVRISSDKVGYFPK